MHKRIKFVAVISLFLVVSTLTGCSSNVEMPKTKGKQVQMTNTELERKFDRLSFNLQTDKILQLNYQNTLKEVEGEDSVEANIHGTSTRNYNNYETWTNHTSEEKINYGVIKATVNGYESDRYTYIDINRDSNLKFDDLYYNQYNYNIYNGKYQIEKSDFGGNSLQSVLNYYNIGFVDPSFHYISTFIEFGLLLELNNYRYSNLKFYENDEYFSISLKSNLNGLKKERFEIYDAFQDHIELPDEHLLLDFVYDFVLVFERNKIIAAGLYVKAEADKDVFGDDHYTLTNVKIAAEYVKKTPKEIKYDQYKLIDQLKEIKK